MSQATNSQSTDDKEFFLLSISKVGRLSPWFISLILLANLPGVCIGFLSLVFVKDSANFRVLCKIPELQNLSWSESQLHNITSENLNICKYRNYNYSLLSGMTFDAALEYVQTLKNKPHFMNCKEYTVLKNTHATIFSDFNLGCNSWSLLFVDLLGNCIADILGGAFIIPIGDLLGRKRMLSWGVNFIFSGDVFVVFALSDIMLAMGWLFLSVGYRLTKVSTELIVLEIANHNFRKTFYFLTHLGTPFGYILAGAVYNLPYHWKHLSMLASVPVLLLPILEWYFPESPSWLLSKKRKTKAFAILENIKQPEMQEQLLQRYKNFDRGYLGTLKDHFKQMKSIFSATRFLHISILFVAVGMVSLESFQWKVLVQFKTYKTLFTHTKFSLECMVLLFGIIPLFLVTKKINVVITAFSLITGLIYISCYGFPFSEKANFATMFLLGNIMGYFSFICTSLFVLEESPTSHRATVVGFVTVTGVGVSKLILIFCIKYLQVEQLCLILAVLSVISFCFPFVMRKLYRNDRNEDYYE